MCPPVLKQNLHPYKKVSINTQSKILLHKQLSQRGVMLLCVLPQQVGLQKFTVIIKGPQLMMVMTPFFHHMHLISTVNVPQVQLYSIIECESLV